MTEDNGPMFLKGYVPANNKPIEDTVKYYVIGLSSFEMMTKPKVGRKPNKGQSMPIHWLKLGESFKIPLDRPETTLRAVMRQAQKKNPEATYRLIRHATHYEIGRTE